MKQYILFSISIAIAIATFYLLRPDSFVDNDKSQIVCRKNGSAFDIGPNYIYTLEKQLDNFNDRKARKLCEYGIIRDYGDTYSTPSSVNYDFKPKILSDLSWLDAVYISLSILIIVYSSVKASAGNFSPDPKFLLISVLAGLIFFILIKNPINQIFCIRSNAKKVVNFQSSAFKNGVFRSEIEDAELKKAFAKSYQSCLKK